MKFLVDVQLPSTLARWLRGRDCDAVHALERDLGQIDDLTLWNLAIEEGRIMISKDQDFFILAMRPKDSGRLLWLRIGNSSDNRFVDASKSALERNRTSLQRRTASCRGSLTIGQYKDGNAKAINALKCPVMKATKGKAKPTMLDELLKKLIDEG